MLQLDHTSAYHLGDGLEDRSLSFSSIQDSLSQYNLRILDRLLYIDPLLKDETVTIGDLENLISIGIEVP